jgi:chaperonin cofactor prefoldin
MVARMIHRLIGGALRRSIQEEITPQFDDLKGQLRDLTDSQNRLVVRVDELGSRLDNRIDAVGERLDRRIDSLSDRFDTRMEGLDTRIGELAAQQGRMVEEVASLKRDKESAVDLVHRVTRIEDRLFARAS